MMPRHDARQEVGRPSIGGAVAMLVTLPLLVDYLWVSLVDHGGALIFPTTGDAWVWLLGRVPAPTPGAAAIVLGRVLLQAAAVSLAPAPRARDAAGHGSRLAYQVNGWARPVAHLGCLGARVWMGSISPAVVADQFGPS